MRPDFVVQQSNYHSRFPHGRSSLQKFMLVDWIAEVLAGRGWLGKRFVLELLELENGGRVMVEWMH